MTAAETRLSDVANQFKLALAVNGLLTIRRTDDDTVQFEIEHSAGDSDAIALRAEGGDIVWCYFAEDGEPEDTESIPAEQLSVEWLTKLVEIKIGFDLGPD
jgi:hypothetical protein